MNLSVRRDPPLFILLSCGCIFGGKRRKIHSWVHYDFFFLFFRPTLTMNVDWERFSPKDSSFVFSCSTSESHLTISVPKISPLSPEVAGHRTIAANPIWRETNANKKYCGNHGGNAAPLLLQYWALVHHFYIRIHRILILIINNSIMGSDSYFTSLMSGLHGYFGAILGITSVIGGISSYSTLLHSILQPRTRKLYPNIINVDCCVVYMHHIPRNPPGAARIVLSLSLVCRRLPGTPLVDSIITSKYAPNPAPRPQYFMYIYPSERGRE